MNDQQQPTGAVRSADVANLSFTSLPIIGLFGLARTAGEGAEKYGRLNYMQGFPVHDLLEHTLSHIFLYVLGDRSEPHLEHAAWGLLVAVQQETLDPELSKPHMLGPGATLTPEVLAELKRMNPILKERRQAGQVNGEWKTSLIPQVAKILKQRAEAKAESASVSDDKKPVAINELIKLSILDRFRSVQSVSWEKGSGFCAKLLNGISIFEISETEFSSDVYGQIKDEIRKLNNLMRSERSNAIQDIRFIVTRDGVKFTS